MKKFYTLCLLMIGAMSFAQISDSFSGTGTLTANGWVSHSGTADQLTISTGSLSYTGLTSTGNKAVLVAGNNEDVNKASASSITGLAYYSAVLNLPNTTGLHPNTATGDYFLMNSATAGATGVTSFSARLYIRTGSAADTFNIGILNNSGGTAAPSYVSTDYPINTPIFVVVKYDLSTNTASLFVNPVIGSTEGTATVTNATGTTAAPTQIAALAIRQGGNATTGTGNVQIDELRLGGTWSSVTSGTLGISQNAIDGLKVYPNPVTNGTFYINTTADQTKEVVVYDVLGKQVVKTTTTNAVNVSNLKSGVYIVKITEEGKTATRKLVIK
ncbi:MAG: T9SS type A sorting domain-containing protein [Flavobacterium sp.]|nr:MAG: T9SS type A sorting domain-containing protein [Flavobacterium sp.]